MKACRHCTRQLPTSAFPANSKTRDGLSSWCRDCHRAATRASRARHGAKYNAARRGTLRVKAGARAAIADDPGCGQLLTVVAGDPCAYCGKPAGTGRELDHIEPTADGGPNVVDNFTATCRGCNNEKQNDPLLLFLLKRRVRTTVGRAARGKHGAERIMRELAGHAAG